MLLGTIGALMLTVLGSPPCGVPGEPGVRMPMMRQIVLHTEREFTDWDLFRRMRKLVDGAYLDGARCRLSGWLYCGE